MRRILLLILLISIPISLFSYTTSTVDVTGLIYNNSFDSGTSGWTPLFTAGLSNVSTATILGRSCVVLLSLFTTTTVNARAAIQTWDGTGTSANYHVIDFSTASPPYTKDALIIKVYFMGAEASGTLSGGTVSGQFTIFLQSGLSLTDSTSTATWDSDTSRTFQSNGFTSISSDSIFGVMTTWNVMTFTFTPPGYGDWWQIRNILLSYKAAPNQTMQTQLAIDRIEMYAIKVDDQ